MADLPDVLTDEQMAKLGAKPYTGPPSKVPAPNDAGKLPVEEPLTDEQMAYRQHLAGIHEQPLIHEDPAMDVATMMAGGAAGKLAARGLKMGAKGAIGGLARLSPVVADLAEPAIASGTTSALQGGNLKQNLIAGGIGGLLGVPGAALGIIRRAPGAVAERLPTAVTGGLKTKAAGKVVTSGALNDVLDAHPDLKRILATSTDPEEKAAAIERTMADLRGKTDPFYQGVDASTAAERYGQAKANVAGLSDKAAQAKRAADELAGAANQPRDLFDEARKIDAPQAREPDLLEAARKIDAPISAKDAAQEGRERVATEARAANDSSNAAKAAARDAATQADQLQRQAEKAWNKLENSPKSPGIDISAIDRNLKKQAVALAREGRSTEALAVGRGRKQLAELYGENGEIPAGTILPARAVRTLANDLGESAFTGDVTTPVPKKTLAQQRIYGAVTSEIEKAAQKAGLNLDELRSLNKQISTLIPVQGVTAEQAKRAALAGPEDKLAQIIKKPAHVVAGLANSIPAHADYALANNSLLQRFASGAPGKLLSSTSVAAPLVGSAVNRKVPQDELEYSARIAEFMKDGLSLPEAMKKAEEQ
jgi:hypothetical protein